MPIQFACPSSHSVAGLLIDSIQPASKGDERIPEFGLFQRIVLSAGLGVAASLDLFIWTVKTVTIYPVYRVGGWAHVASLMSTLVVPLFALRVLSLGEIPQENPGRPFDRCGPFGPVVRSFSDSVRPLRGRPQFGLLQRIALSGGLLLATSLDLFTWTVMTATIYPACRVGGWAHVANLISILAAPFFVLIFLSAGALPSVEPGRPFHLVGPVVNPWIQKLCYGDITREGFEGALDRKYIRRGSDWNEYHSLQLEFYLSRGADPNAQSANGETLLIAASKRGKAFVDLLFQANAAVRPSLRVEIKTNLPDREGFSAIDFLLTGICYDTLRPRGSVLHDFQLPQRVLAIESSVVKYCDHDAARYYVSDYSERGYSGESTQLKNKLHRIWRSHSYGTSESARRSFSSCIQTLLSQGALIQSFEFEEYMGFVNKLQEAAEAAFARKANAFADLIAAAPRSENRYIRLIGKTLLADQARMTACTQQDASLWILFDNATLLVDCKRKLLEMSEAGYRKTAETAEKELIGFGMPKVLATFVREYALLAAPVV